MHGECTVFVEAKADDTLARLGELLEPFSEHTQVEPYERTCEEYGEAFGLASWCLGDDCECKGTGTVTTTYNPLSRWDYWTPRKWYADPGDPTVAVLTPDEGWHARRPMGAGARLAKAPVIPEDDWGRLYRATFERYREAGYAGVVIDFHT